MKENNMGGRLLKRSGVAVLGVLASAMVGGCASTPSGEVFSSLVEPRDDSALLYLYRPDEYYGKGLSFTVLVDGRETGDIGNGGYMIIPLAAGKHVVQVKGFGYKDEPREIEAQKAALGFLKVVTTKGFGGFSATLTLESEEQSKAVPGLAGLKREPERFLDQGV
jgi:hypothetical protein